MLAAGWKRWGALARRRLLAAAMTMAAALPPSPGRAEAAPAACVGSAPATAASDVSQACRTGKRVSFHFQDIPIRAALQLLAEVSGLNLVAADSVSGNLTLRLVEVPWEQALDVVLRAKGLDQRRQGNLIWIAPQRELADYEQHQAEARLKAADSAELVADYVPVSYGKAADIAKLLGRGGAKAGESGAAHGFLSPRGSVSYDERTNTLLLNDTPQKLAALRKLIGILDQPVQQVLIESRIVVASDSFSRELGARFGVGSGSSPGVARVGGALQVDQDSGAVGGAGGLNVNLPVSGAAGSLAVAVLGRHYALDLELSAAQGEGRSELISSPRAVVANNQEAAIRQGQEIGYVTYQNSLSNEVGSGTATVQFKDAVLELKVTPTITADHRVFLKINLTKDSLDHYENVPNNGQVPVIDTNAMNTSVLIEDGQTVVLGGIRQHDQLGNLTKVPGLGDLPLLGALFRHRSRQRKHGELLIFVTPRILGAGAR